MSGRSAGGPLAAPNRVLRPLFDPRPLTIAAYSLPVSLVVRLFVRNLTIGVPPQRGQPPNIDEPVSR